MWQCKVVVTHCANGRSVLIKISKNHLDLHGSVPGKIENVSDHPPQLFRGFPGSTNGWCVFASVNALYGWDLTVIIIVILIGR